MMALKKAVSVEEEEIPHDDIPDSQFKRDQPDRVLRFQNCITSQIVDFLHEGDLGQGISVWKKSRINHAIG